MSGTSIRVLIVEDFHVDTESLLAELKEAELDHESSVVGSSATFEAELARFRPHVILSPYSLKDSNAVKLLGIARKMGCDAPFILLAFDLSEDIAIDLLAEGVEDYVLRPTIKRLPVAIKKALQRHKTQLELIISERKLRNSEASLRNMVRNAPIAVAMFDLNMHYLVVSEKWLEHENKTAVDLIGNSHYDVVQEIPESWKIVHRACLSGETCGSDGDELIRKDGKKEILRWKMNPWYDADGGIGGAVLFIEDITDLIDARQKLNEERIHRDLAVKAAEIGVWHLVLGNTVTAYWDKRCFELFGIPDERLSAEDFFHLLHPDDVEPVKNKVIHSFQTGSYEAEYRVLKGDRYVVISAKGKTTFDDKGNPIRLDGILLDITERKAKEESIKTLSLVASETTNGVLIQDSLGRITWANQGFTSITGYTHEEALGKEPWSFLSCPKTDQNLVEITYRKMKAGETFRSENVLLTKKGLEIWVSTTFNPILDENGELKQVVSIGVDITNQKEQETHQKNLLEELERKNEELRRDAKR